MLASPEEIVGLGAPAGPGEAPPAPGGTGPEAPPAPPESPESPAATRLASNRGAATRIASHAPAPTMLAAKNVRKIPLTSVRMADAEGTVGGSGCKGKSR